MRKLAYRLNWLLNKYGDGILFRAVARTAPIRVNPNANTGIHTAVPHKYVFAYITAIKSFLRYYSDIAVYVHDDGTLSDADQSLINYHIPGVQIIKRSWANENFSALIHDEFLETVRSSYTSYLKLFDPSLVGRHRRIIVMDTDVLFLRQPDAIIRWIQNGGNPWFHRSEPWIKSSDSKLNAKQKATSSATAAPTHIQGMVVECIEDMSKSLGKHYKFVNGFNSGLLGYERGVIDYKELRELLSHLYDRFGERIFKWGSEQTMHGLLLCSKGALELPMDDYMVYTNLTHKKTAHATFVHFIGEHRYRHMLYPRLAARVIRELASGSID